MFSKDRLQTLRQSLGIVVLLILLAPITFISLPPISGATPSTAQVLEKSLGAAFSAAFRTAKTSTSYNSKLGSVRMTISLDNYYKCKSGGSIHTIGSYGGIVTTKQIFLSGQFHQTILDWRCVSGWVINGDPYLSYTVSQFGSGKTVTTSFTRAGGWLGKNKSGSKLSCQGNADGAFSLFSGGHVNVHARCVPGGAINFSQQFK